jgi:hypothetical protein
MVCVIFGVGKNHNGSFSNEDIVQQVCKAMEILKKHYLHEDHIFIYNNVATHQKHPENAPTAQKMHKNTPKNGKNWLVEVTMCNKAAVVVCNKNGDVKKMKEQMLNGEFNGKCQSFYYDHAKHPSVFKGMVKILFKCGFENARKLLVGHPKFKCPPWAPNVTPKCYCQHILYEEVDFTEGKSILEVECKKQGFEVLFLPKFHCELNFIEMCWVRAKYHYELNPPLSKEEDLWQNMISALSTVTLTEMQR